MEIFKFEQQLKLESMAQLNRIQDHEIKEEYAVQIAQMQDRLFKKFGIEQEEYNMAISYHELTKDPEVQKILKSVEDQQSPELKQRII